LPLPELNRFGDLPPGVHLAQLEEVLRRFGSGSNRRTLLGARLQRIWTLAAATGKVSRFILFGSLVSGGVEPNDVDVFLLMDDSFEVKTLRGEMRLVFDHAAAQAHFGASIFGCVGCPRLTERRPWSISGQQSVMVVGAV
jgi:hypothetical protein